MDDESRAEVSLSRFIERLGLYFEDFGLPRIGGRLLGLLLITDRPLSLEEVASALQISRGSVSTNARLVVAAGLVERVAFPGNRRDYYAFSERAWDAVIETDAKGVTTLHTLATDALEGLGASDTPARARLQATIEFLEFYNAELAATLARWRAHNSAGSPWAATQESRDGRAP